MSHPVQPSSTNNASQRRWSGRFNSFVRPFSSTSLASFAASINTPLPEYSLLHDPETLELVNIASQTNRVHPQTDNEPPPGAPFPTTSTLEISSATNLPRYSTLSNVPVASNDSGGPSVPHFEHSFSIPGFKKPWASLHTFTLESVPRMICPSRIKPEVPLFYGGEPVTGLLELELDSPHPVHEITVSIQGEVLSGFIDNSVRILDFKFVLWNKSMGEPRSPPSQVSTKDFDGKLSGSYQFPFSFPFPVQLDLSSLSHSNVVDPFPLNGASSSFPRVDAAFPAPSAGSSRQIDPFPLGSTSSTKADTIFPAPPSFSDGSIPGSVRYELVVGISHGRFRQNSKINTPISYMPSTTSPPPSRKRLSAYGANSIPPGPLSDPQGWFALPDSLITGELHGGKQVNIIYVLHLAKPLSYTRGSTIPCFLTMLCEDSNALDVLCNPKTPHVRLIRRVRHFSPFGNSQDSASVSRTSSLGKLTKAIRSEVSAAVWWVPSKDVIQKRNCRYLEGEMHLPPDLKPSFSHSLFMIEYIVEFLPFTSSIFEPAPAKNPTSHPKKQVVGSCRVEVATLYSPGVPQPVAFSKPTGIVHKSETSNGDQRFLDAAFWLLSEQVPAFS